MRTPFIAANWKMYKTVHEAVVFVKEFRKLVQDVSDVEIVVAPPFTAAPPRAGTGSGAGWGGGKGGKRGPGGGGGGARAHPLGAAAVVGRRRRRAVPHHLRRQREAGQYPRAVVARRRGGRARGGREPRRAELPRDRHERPPRGRLRYNSKLCSTT